MDVLGKKDDEGIKKLLAAAEAMKLAGLPVPDSIKERLGEDFEEKSPNELCTVKLESPAVLFHQLEGRTGVKIVLKELPKDLLELMIFPHLAPKKSEPEEKSDSDESKKELEKTSGDSLTSGTPGKSDDTSIGPKKPSDEDEKKDESEKKDELGKKDEDNIDTDTKDLLKIE